MNHNWMQTRDGKAHFFHDPKAETIDPDTIATVLSRICRFGGHTKDFYSVAQHSCLVSHLVQLPELKLPALLHDAHEAYTGFGDVVGPAKWYFEEQVGGSWMGYHEKKMDLVIAERFGFDAELFYHPSVRHADMKALATEGRDLLGPKPFPWIELPEPCESELKVWDMERAKASFDVALRKCLKRKK